MAKRKVQTVKKAKPKKRMTRANKLSLEEMHYGPEPEVGYFDDHNLSAYLIISMIENRPSLLILHTQKSKVLRTQINLKI